MKKKNVIIGVAAMAAVAVVSIGGTLAYLTDKTEARENLFSTSAAIHGNIDEKFDETGAGKYLPGGTIYKAPWIKLDEDSVDAYVAMKVTVKEENTADGQSSTGSFMKFTDFEANIGKIQWDGNLLSSSNSFSDWKPAGTPGAYNTGAWTLVDNTNEKARFYVYGTKNTEGTVTLKKLTKTNDTTEPLFNYVQIVDGVKLNSAGQYPRFKVIVQGYLVQADSIEAEAAVKELAALTGENGSEEKVDLKEDNYTSDGTPVSFELQP